MRMLVDDLNKVMSDIELLSTMYITEDSLSNKDSLDAIDMENDLLRKIECIKTVILSTDNEIIKFLKEVNEQNVDNKELCKKSNRLINLIKKKAEQY